MSASSSWMNWLPQARGAMGLGSSLTGGGNSALGNTFGGAGNALGVLGGIERGGVSGDTSAAVNAAQLGGKAGLFGANTSTVNQGVGDAADVLGMYQGIQQGGVGGYGTAGIDATKLATSNGLLGGTGGALGQAASYAAIPLDLYNEVNNWKSGSTGSDAIGGAETGAAIGSVVPVLGTAAGALIGGAAGALSSLFGPGAKDPETSDVQNVINATSANQNNPGVAASVQDPYLQLAGLMDERSSTLPEYQQYGRMGEQAFTNAMTGQINDALKANPSLASDPSAVYNQVVAPWVNSMGSGYSNVGSTYAATNQGLLEDMTDQYLSGNAAQDWKAVGGDSPFANIYANSPLAAEFAPAATTPTQPSTQMTARRGANGQQMLAAKGGAIKDPEMASKLRRLYEGSFANREPRHFATGGDNPGYYSMAAVPQYSNFNFNLPGANAPSSGSNASGVPTDVASPDNSGAYGMGYYNANAPYTNTDPSAGGGSSASSNGGTGSILGQGGALSGLGSLLGVSSMGQLVKQYGALAPLLAAALGGNKPASAPATPAGYGAIPSIPTPTNNRSYTQPNVANWYTYGQGPEQSFFSNNQLPTVPGVSPSSGTGAAPATGATPTTGAQPNVPSPRLQLPVMAGGGSFDSTQGDDYVPDPGHGDGTSDGIDAKLSGGEYVMDAGTVATLGNGSNEAGARALDQLRQRVRKHAGKQLVKGKQFMKAKAPQAYLSGSGGE